MINDSAGLQPVDKALEIEKISSLFSAVRNAKPLVHCITNYVTVNDCANAILALGGSPIMADYIHEVTDIVRLSRALVLNIGTLNENTVESMMAAGQAANCFHLPVVFDPVGAGASAYRNETTRRILQKMHVDVIRGNLSEMSFIAGIMAKTKGVDNAVDCSEADTIGIARKIAQENHCIAAITGAIDTVTDGNRVYRIQNGTAELSRVTGTGCMTTALIGSLCGTTDNYLSATTAAIACMGIAGEIAEREAKALGTGSFRTSIINAISLMDAGIFSERARIYEA